MIVWQIDGTDKTYVLLVIEPDNLERMRSADPITLNPATMGGLLRPIAHPEQLHILVCYEEQVGRVYELIQAGDNPALLTYLMRGWRFTSQDGKHFHQPGHTQGQS